ncbi:hypothetical protein [Paenibacillus tianjinensis]|uniref:Uncharacterized protein n=1 Tax=Paenibacillus tianjinensis TaxID=2810347 RepID=A0ABX7L493_9BACL|nr:hypothetical protein [Paenibacillus tianjinensis]QSF42680.1 hypothetical protein JRJ22_15300 [Paenibacillus tianjinensis]
MNWRTATHQELYTVLQDKYARRWEREAAETEILRRCKPKFGRVQYKIKERA